MGLGLNVPVENDLMLSCRYVMHRIEAVDPAMQVSSEDLGGARNEQQDPQIKEVVEHLLRIADNLNQNAELQK